MRSLFLECNAGISGDMLVAAMLDLGADRDALDEALQSIPDKGFTYKISRVDKDGLDCCSFDVILDGEHENHDHDMEYLHGDLHKDDEHFHEHKLPSHMPENEHLLDHGNESAYHDGYYSEHDYMHEHEVQPGHEFLQAHQPHILSNHEYPFEENNDVVHEHHHEHRTLKDVMEIINQVNMTKRARKIALKIFDILAEAEAAAHGVSKEKVHFHEVGALDSIVDVIAIAVCFDNLRLKEILTVEVREGQGTIRCQHGILPIPVPATAYILKKYKIPRVIMPVEGEFVTPTGAAAVAALRVARLPGAFSLLEYGHGAGKRNYKFPSVLRASILLERTADVKKQDKKIAKALLENEEVLERKIDKLPDMIAIYKGESKYNTVFEAEAAEHPDYKERTPEEVEADMKEHLKRSRAVAEDVLEEEMQELDDKILDIMSEQSDEDPFIKGLSKLMSNKFGYGDDAPNSETVYKLETNLDDITGEKLGYVMDLLLQAGALDVCYLPIYMKKNRPAYQLQVLCRLTQVAAMETIIYSETTTLGIRRYLLERSYLERHEEEVNTMYGPIKVKVCDTPAGERYAVEYESAAAAAKKHNVPLQEVYHEVDANFT